MTNPAYELIRLRNGAMAVRSLDDAETMHPAIGPAAEAEALYVRQLRLPERFAQHRGEFVVWDVGLGAGANAIAVLRCFAGESVCSARPASRLLRLLSFDSTIEPLRFALDHSAELLYLAGFEEAVAQLIAAKEAHFRIGDTQVNWRAQVGDFPNWLATVAAGGRSNPPAPHAILFDPFSPVKNPALWTTPLFTNLFRATDPQRPCSLATYSRSTMVRVALLLAGFFVGTGHPVGLKEETTLAASCLEVLEAPLARHWLERARRSDAAEPLWEPKYRRARLTEETYERMCSHPQFAGL